MLIDILYIVPVSRASSGLDSFSAGFDRHFPSRCRGQASFPPLLAGYWVFVASTRSGAQRRRRFVCLRVLCCSSPESLCQREFENLITSAQMRAARALLGMDQKRLAELAGVSQPTIQRMEASEGNVRGVVDSLTKVVEAFDRAGIELIGENAPSSGTGRGVRFKNSAPSGSSY